MRRPNQTAPSAVLAAILLAALGLGQGACISSNRSADASVGDVHGSASRNDTATGHRDSAVSIDLPPIDNCQPFTNLGCEVGRKCAALEQSDGTLALGCDAVGSQGEGAPCVQVMASSGAVTVQVDDDCADGLACFSMQAGVAASCHRMCKSDGSQVCPGAEICSLVAPGLASIGFCRATRPCSPVDQTGCAVGEACYWSSPGPLCATAGNGKIGDACANANDCVPGATCVALSPSRCVAFCSTTGTLGCVSGSACAAISSTAAAANVGYCQ